MKVSTKENSDTIGFFGELCPFSNFYEAEFIWNGYIYHCSEQYIQHQKAKYCGDVVAANEIMSCKTALQCKRASRNIENYRSDDWTKFAESECIKGLVAKFDQNLKLKTILLNTGDKTLIECSWDQVWGTGCPLSRPDCLDADNWESQGLLGTMFMAVRKKLKLVTPVQTLQNIPPLASTTTDSGLKNSLESPAPMDTAPQPLSDNNI